VALASGADEVALETWFAHGMLLNVAASIGDVKATKEMTLASLGGST
jgi:hypothetical protein